MHGLKEIKAMNKKATKKPVVKAKKPVVKKQKSFGGVLYK